MREERVERETAKTRQREERGEEVNTHQDWGRGRKRAREVRVRERKKVLLVNEKTKFIQIGLFIRYRNL